MIVLKDHTIKAFGDIDELTEDVETFMDWIITEDMPSDVLERFIRIFKRKEDKIVQHMMSTL